MTAPLSRYFDKADVSIFTSPPQDQTIRSSRPALGILVSSTRSSCQAPDVDPGNRLPARRIRPLLHNGPPSIVVLASALAIVIFFLSVTAAYFVRGHASPSSVVSAEMQSSSEPAPAAEVAIDSETEILVAALLANEKPSSSQEADVQAPAAEPPETKPLPKPLVFERFGTSVDFLRDPDEAAREAGKQGKLLFVLHVSGDFEDAALT